MPLLFTNRQRIVYTRVAVCLTLIAIFLLSYKLWLNERNYPLAPVLDLFPALPSPFDYAQLILPLLLLILGIVFRKASVYLLLFFVLFWLLVLGDQNRLQPYCYQFAIMLLVLAVHGNSDNPEREQLTLNCLRVIIAGSYLWAGIHKFNGDFVSRFYPYLAGSGAASAELTLKHYAFLVLPLIEISMAIGLLTSRFREISLNTANLMHIVIAVVLSPIGIGWNYVVIPWNIGLIFINIFLFSQVKESSAAQILHPQRSLLKVMALLLFFVMPLFNLFGMWDHYISSSLYSFKTPYAKVYVDDALKTKLPPYVTKYCFKDDTGQYVETTYWMVGEVNVLPYPERRVYERAESFICTFETRDSCHARLVIY